MKFAFALALVTLLTGCSAMQVDVGPPVGSPQVLHTAGGAAIVVINNAPRGEVDVPLVGASSVPIWNTTPTTAQIVERDTRELLAKLLPQEYIDTVVVTIERAEVRQHNSAAQNAPLLSFALAAADRLLTVHVDLRIDIMQDGKVLNTLEYKGEAQYRGPFFTPSEVKLAYEAAIGVYRSQLERDLRAHFMPVG